MTPHVLPSTPEEYAAGLKAIHALQQIVDQHNEGQRHGKEARNENDEPFLYGQDFDTKPEIWDLEDYDYYNSVLRYL